MITDYVGRNIGQLTSNSMVTELNSVSSNPGKQTTSLVNGLFMADAIGQPREYGIQCLHLVGASRRGEYTANNSSSLYGWRPYGDYGVVPPAMSPARRRIRPTRLFMRPSC